MCILPRSSPWVPESRISHSLGLTGSSNEYVSVGNSPNMKELWEHGLGKEKRVKLSDSPEEPDIKTFLTQQEAAQSSGRRAVGGAPVCDAPFRTVPSRTA